jgi:hypothetical protein
VRNDLIYKIALYGDSLACPRQGLVKSNERYIALLEKYIRSHNSFGYIEIRDKAIGGATIQKLQNEFLEDNTYFELPGDIFILHSGIVDCAPRPVNDHTRGRISKLPSFLRKPIIKYIHNNRAKLLQKNGGYVKTDLNKFINAFDNIVDIASRNYKNVFVINICPTLKRFEERSPGFTKNINLYNERISYTIKNFSNIRLVDINSFIKQNENQIENYIVKEDGHHIHPITHQWIAQQIIDNLS